MCLNDNIISSHLMKLRYLKVNHLLSVEHSNLEEGKLEEEASVSQIQSSVTIIYPYRMCLNVTDHYIHNYENLYYL